MSKPRDKRDLALLRAFDTGGREIVHEELDLHDYWDGTHPLIDSAEHRKKLGVVRVVGDLYAGGKLLQHFENTYGGSGEYVRGRAEHADGTVNED